MRVNNCSGLISRYFLALLSVPPCTHIHTRIKIIEYYWIHISLIYIFPTCYMLYIPMEIYAAHFIFATHIYKYIHTYKCLYFFVLFSSTSCPFEFDNMTFGVNRMSPSLGRAFEALSVWRRCFRRLRQCLHIPLALYLTLYLERCPRCSRCRTAICCWRSHPHTQWSRFTRNTLSFSFAPDQQPVLHHHMLGYWTKEDFSGIFSIFTSVHFWTCTFLLLLLLFYF